MNDIGGSYSLLCRRPLSVSSDGWWRKVVPLALQAKYTQSPPRASPSSAETPSRLLRSGRTWRPFPDFALTDPNIPIPGCHNQRPRPNEFANVPPSGGRALQVSKVGIACFSTIRLGLFDRQIRTRAPSACEKGFDPRRACAILRDLALAPCIVKPTAFRTVRVRSAVEPSPAEWLRIPTESVCLDWSAFGTRLRGPTLVDLYAIGRMRARSSARHPRMSQVAAGTSAWPRPLLSSQRQTRFFVHPPPRHIVLGPSTHRVGARRYFPPPARPANGACLLANRIARSCACQKFSRSFHSASTVSAAELRSILKPAAAQLHHDNGANQAAPRLALPIS